MATAKIEVPHVYEAIAAVLKHLSVDKNGKLPSNMGSGSYLQAHDVTSEVKNQFTKNELIFISNEEIVSEEHIIFKDRLNLRVLIKGTYQIISTRDGSNVTITGLGDGLATGTAVASNIGSTNALKNALLRTFLITEQAVEDGMMRDMVNADTSTAPGPKTSAIDRAKSKVAPKEGTGWRAKVKKEFLDTGKATKEVVNTHMEAARETGLKGEEIWKQVHTVLSS